MRQFIAVSFAAAVLATIVGTAVAVDDGELKVRRQVTHERVVTLACDGVDCGVRVRHRGDGVRNLHQNTQVARPDWRNPYRHRDVQMVSPDWRNPYRRNAKAQPYTPSCLALP